MQDGYTKTKDTRQFNNVFMLKIMLQTESTCVFVSTNKVLDVMHQTVSANISSLNEKVDLEFYDVIDESAFDSRTADNNDMSNMKLLAM